MAISDVERAAYGARSVSLFADSSTGASETISNAQLQADASAVDQASLAIYADFLNLSGLADGNAVTEEFAALGGIVSIIGSSNLSNIKWAVDGSGKPTLLVTTSAATKLSVRIALASSISA
jgi:hypothetical protein